MGNDSTEARSAPVKAVWVILVLAWICFLVPIGGVGVFVGAPLNLVAFIIAIVVITRGKTGVGVFQLLCTLVVSPAVYYIGFSIFISAIDSEMKKSEFDHGYIHPTYVVSVA